MSGVLCRHWVGDLEDNSLVIVHRTCLPLTVLQSKVHVFVAVENLEKKHERERERERERKKERKREKCFICGC